MSFNRYITIYFILLPVFVPSEAAAMVKTHYLQQGVAHNNFASALTNLNIFCYPGKPKYLINLWQSVVLQIDHATNDYTQYDGTTPEEVQKEYEEHRHSWSVNLFSWKQKQIKLDPFNHSCVGIESSDAYEIILNVIRIDYWKVLSLVFGVCLYLSADRLSKNAIFYYICGVVLGICTSFLILFYLLSKLFPKKPMMYGVVACGWTVGIYILQLLWDNVRVILLNYKMYLAWYALITGVISLIICYRWGPVENERTLNLIRWMLQLVGLGAIFTSTHFQEAAMGQIVLLLLSYNIPPSWLNKPKKYWKKKFPPKVKLLTNDEYYEQGVRETTKALSELKEFCSSPQCNQWKTALKLKDVKRFASFIEGNSHLSDEEILEYECSIQTTDLTDDEEMTDDENTEEEAES